MKQGVSDFNFARNFLAHLVHLLFKAIDNFDEFLFLVKENESNVFELMLISSGQSLNRKFNIMDLLLVLYCLML